MDCEMVAGVYRMNWAYSDTLVHALRWDCMVCTWVLMHALGGVGSNVSFGMGRLLCWIEVRMLVWIGCLIGCGRGVGLQRGIFALGWDWTVHSFGGGCLGHAGLGWFVGVGVSGA